MMQDPILIVDDDDNLRTVMAEALEVLPVQITQASSGQQAIDLLGTRSPSPTPGSRSNRAT